MCELFLPKKLSKDTFENNDSLSSDPLTETQPEHHKKAVPCQSRRPACSDSVLGEMSSTEQTQEVETVPAKNEKIIGEKITESVEMVRDTETPVELNATLLHTLFKFNPMSNLKAYLSLIHI